MTVSDARARLADVVDSARVGHNPVYLTRRGQRVAAVIDSEDLDRLIAAAEDLAEYITKPAAKIKVNVLAVKIKPAAKRIAAALPPATCTAYAGVAELVVALALLLVF